MSAILTGARKYGLGLILAHQDLDQLAHRDNELANSVLSNPAIRVCFRCGDKDATKLESGFSFLIQPIYKVYPLVNPLFASVRKIMILIYPLFYYQKFKLQLRKASKEQLLIIVDQLMLCIKVKLKKYLEKLYKVKCQFQLNRINLQR